MQIKDRTIRHLRHVLFIAYFYPPADHAGTRRVVKFVKYLPASGYQPIVLTTATRGSLADDAETLTFRAGELSDVVARPYRAIKLRNVSTAERANTWAVSPESRLAPLLRACLIPDMHVTWYPLAVRQGRKVLRSQLVQILYSSSPPETNHLVALRLKRETGIPWVADFRDGWMFEPLNRARLTSSLRYRLESKMERQVVLNADRIIAVNDVLAEDLSSRYPEASGKVNVISNGYDPDDFKHLRRQATADKFRVVYTGSLAWGEGGRSVTGLLKALREMHDRGHSIMQSLQICLVGRLASAELAAIAASGLADYFSTPGQVPHQQALQFQTDADVLLLVTDPNATSVSTSKLFEYLAIGRPILALTGPSAAGKLIAELGVGRVVEPNDIVGIEVALQGFYDQWRTGQLPTDMDDRVRRFNRQELTKNLAAVFDELLRGNTIHRR